MDRRSFLTKAGVGTYAMLSDRVFSFNMFAGPGVAGYGVASGDPTQDSVVLWTRLPDEIAARENIHHVTAIVSTDPSFSPTKIIRRVQKLITSDRDYCCKIFVDDLPENSWLFYQFVSDTGYVSEIGRTKTLPSGNTDRLRFAVVSCQDFSVGFYNVYEKISLLDLDFIVHLGDHIYESAETSLDKNYVRHDPIGESVTLEQYRAKYKLYLTDDRLRKVRAMFPFISIWDDHEVFNDYSGSVMSPSEQKRKTAGYQAFLEYNPVAIDSENLTPRLHRSFEVGDLAKFIVLDQRQYRTKQPCTHKMVTRGCEKQFSEQQTMLGAEQLSWFRNQLSAGTDGPTFILNEVMFTPFLVPFSLGGILGYAENSDFIDLRDDSQRFYMSLDSWDGYAFERQKIIDHIAKEKIENIVICTGDIHNYYTANIFQEPIHAKRKLIAGEVLTASISSNGIGDFVGSSLSKVAKGLIDTMNPHFSYSELDHHGCLVFEVDRDSYTVTALAVTTTKSTHSRAVKLYSNRYDLKR